MSRDENFGDGRDYYSGQDHHFETGEDQGRQFLQGNLKGISGKLLDLGCGDGRDMMFYQRMGFEVWGTEISSDMTRLARNRGLTVIQDDNETVLQGSRIFPMNVICSRYGAHFIATDLHHFYSLVYQRLDANGRYIAIIPNLKPFDSHSRKGRVDYTLFNGKIKVHNVPYLTIEDHLQALRANFPKVEVQELFGEGLDIPNGEEVCDGYGIVAKK